MKILALYGSRFGQAEAVLRRVVGRLEDAGYTVLMLKADEIPAELRPEHYGGVVVAASIIMGRHQRYVRKWVRKNALILSHLPGAFVSVNGASPETRSDWRARAESYVASFVARTGWHPRWTAAFAGALRYSRYDPLTRWIMKRIARSEGGPTDMSRDYEFTDWAAVDRFADVLASGFAEASGGAETAGRPSAEPYRPASAEQPLLYPAWANRRSIASLAQAR